LLATKLQSHWDAICDLCQAKANWPPLNPNRQKRRDKALKELRRALPELIELAKPPRKIAKGNTREHASTPSLGSGA
jgi:hypothetical protein